MKIPKFSLRKIRAGWSRWHYLWFVVGLLFMFVSRGVAQTSTRLLLSANDTVPDHPGFVFGPFSALAMNAKKQVAFLTTLLSPRAQLPAIGRSSGVSFSIVAFQGLVAPVPGTLFDAFGAPSINDSGAIAFYATLRSTGGASAPSSGIFFVANGEPAAAVTSGQEASASSRLFQAFSSPVIGSSGAILFGALTAGNPGASGLYLWTSQGVETVPLPAGFTLGSGELLQPVFQSENESVWLPNDESVRWADDQLFRALAIRSFQQLNFPPDPTASVQVLAPSLDEKPVQMLLVILKGTGAQTMALQGDPTAPVMARLGAGAPTALPLNGVESAITGALGGNIVIGSAAAASPNDLAFYCFCNGRVNRLTQPADFAQVSIQSSGPTIHFLTSDGQHTVAFIAPTPGQSGSNAIFVTSLP